MNVFSQLNLFATPVAILICLLPTGRADTTLAQPLVKAVAEVCMKDSPTAKDYARIAQSTVDFGRRMLQSKDQIQKEIIASGQDSVAIGERLDAKAENWAKLRDELQSLLRDDHRQSPPPQEQPPQHDKENDKQRNENKSESGQDESPPTRDDQESQANKDKQTESSTQRQDENATKDQSTSSKDSPSGGDSNSRDKQNAPSAFGSMKDSQEPTKPPRQQPDPLETQKVGGQVSKGSPHGGNDDPYMVIPLQKLDQLRNLDSPAKLFRMMEGPPTQPTDKKGKDW